MIKGSKLVKRDNVQLSFQEAERVLQRAVELQHKGVGSNSFSISDLQNMAAELGVSAALVHAAVRDVRTQALVSTTNSLSVLDRVIGTARIAVARTVDQMSQSDIRQRIDEYLQGQLFRVKRDLGSRIIWEPSKGLAQSIKRAVDFSDSYRLPSSMQIEVELTPSPRAPDSETDVVIVSDFGPARSEAAVAGGIGVALCAGVGLGVGLLTPWAYPIAAAFAVGGVGITRRAYRSTVQEAMDALERLLDTLGRPR